MMALRHCRCQEVDRRRGFHLHSLGLHHPPDCAARWSRRGLVRLAGGYDVSTSSCASVSRKRLWRLPVPLRLDVHSKVVNSCDGELDATAATAVALVGKRRARGKRRRRPTRRQQVRGTAFCLMNRELAVVDSLPGASGEIRAYAFFCSPTCVAVVYQPALLHWHVGSRPSQALA